MLATEGVMAAKRVMATKATEGVMATELVLATNQKKGSCHVVRDSRSQLGAEVHTDERQDKLRLYSYGPSRYGLYTHDPI